jgi:hypothetical protein
MTRLYIVLVMLFLCSPLQAQLKSGTRWADPSVVKLMIEFPGQGYNATWNLFRCDCGDLLVRSDLHVPGETVSGDVVLVEQQVVLSRGFGEYADQAAASLDTAALMLQLALRLLEHTVPGGPAQVKSRVEVAFSEPTIHLHLDTGAAAGSFFAPWSVEGTVEPGGEDERRFQLQFTFMGGTPQEPIQGTMRLNGLADFAETAFPVSADEPLDGWNLDWRDTGLPGATDADTPLPPAATISELREALKQR